MSRRLLGKAGLLPYIRAVLRAWLGSAHQRKASRLLAIHASAPLAYSLTHPTLCPTPEILACCGLHFTPLSLSQAQDKWIKLDQTRNIPSSRSSEQSERTTNYRMTFNSFLFSLYPPQPTATVTLVHLVIGDHELGNYYIPPSNPGLWT